MEEKKLTDEKTLEFAEGINVSNKTELSDEEIFQKVEYCISRNGTCNGCKYTMEYHRECSCSVLHETEILFNAIHRLQSENATLKTELRKECEEHEEFTKKAKAEIERLTEESNHFFLQMTTLEGIMDAKIQQAVKDTAKEIWFKAKLLDKQETRYDFPLRTFGEWLHERFNLEVE